VYCNVVLTAHCSTGCMSCLWPGRRLRQRGECTRELLSPQPQLSCCTSAILNTQFQDLVNKQQHVFVM
jgi:hypothetical protein